MSSAVVKTNIVAVVVMIVMFGGAGVYVIGTSTHVTVTSTSTVIATTSTVVVTTTSTTLCTTTVTGALGNYRGQYPNGTYWISIDGHYFTGYKILNGTTPTTIPPNGETSNWWIIESC